MSGGDQSILIEKAVAGNSCAFEELMRNYMKSLYNFILLRVPNDEDIKDIIQDTMLSVWQNLGSFDSKSSFKTWVFGIANNKVNDYFRRLYRYRADPINEDFDLCDDYDFTEKSTIGTDVTRAVLGLSSKDKELVHLIFNEQLSYSQISEIIGIPTGTIKSRMAAIKEKLKKRLGEGYYE